MGLLEDCDKTHRCAVTFGTLRTSTVALLTPLAMANINLPLLLLFPLHSPLCILSTHFSFLIFPLSVPHLLLVFCIATLLVCNLAGKMDNQSYSETHCPLGHFYPFNFLSLQEAKVGVSYYGSQIWVQIVLLKQTCILLLNKTKKFVITSIFSHLFTNMFTPSTTQLTKFKRLTQGIIKKWP